MTLTKEERYAKRKARDSTAIAIDKRRAKQRRLYAKKRIEATGKPPTVVVKLPDLGIRPKALQSRLYRLVSGTRQRLTRLNKRGRTLDNTITIHDVKDLWDKQCGLCALTGWELTPIANLPNTVSLDRIDNSKGYTPDNIQLLATQVNTAKNKWQQEQFIAMCKAVADRGL